MAQVLLQIGYRQYVLSIEDAALVAGKLADARIYEAKGYGDTRTVHCYRQEDDIQIRMTVLSDEQLAMAKLAGKPSKQDT